MTQNSYQNCRKIYLEAFILPKQSDITIAEMELADKWLNRGNNETKVRAEYAEDCF